MLSSNIFTPDTKVEIIITTKQIQNRVKEPSKKDKLLRKFHGKEKLSQLLETKDNVGRAGLSQLLERFKD